MPLRQNIIFGEVHSIAPASSASFSLLPPQNASGNFVKVVQRVPVKITFKTPENMLGRIVPGFLFMFQLKQSHRKNKLKI